MKYFDCVIKIVVIVGFVSCSIEVFGCMIDVGLNVVCFNFSYGDFEDYCQMVQMVCDFVVSKGVIIGIL